MGAGVISALRVDHPDGLADPGGYLTQLAQATDGAWIVAEKILAPDESLPTSWPVAGTTGYDAAWRIDQLQVDPAGAARLGALMQEITGGTHPWTMTASSRRPSARSSPAHWPRKSTVWPASWTP